MSNTAAAENNEKFDYFFDSNSNIKLQLLSALFPYISPVSLEECLLSSDSIEKAIFSANALSNPNLSSAAYLMDEKQLLKSHSKDPNYQKSFLSGNNAKNDVNAPFGTVERLLQTRLFFLDDEVISHAVNCPEYDTTVAVFPIDTSAWDDQFIAGASMADAVGARPLTLLENNGVFLLGPGGYQDSCATEAPIVRWAPVANGVDGGNKENMRNVSDALNGDALGRLSLAHVNMGKKGLPTLVEYRMKLEKELKEAITAIEAEGKHIFYDDEPIDFCKDVYERCYAIATLIPEFFSKSLYALQQELQGTKLIEGIKEMRGNPVFSGIASCGEVIIKEIVFGRSRIAFAEDGSYIDMRVKLKSLKFDPVPFVIRKEAGGDPVKNGEMRLKVKDVKMRGKIFMRLFPIGRLEINSEGTDVSIGSLYTKCSILRIQTLCMFLQPCIKKRIEDALAEHLTNGIGIGIG